jgi:hypothetical protein
LTADVSKVLKYCSERGIRLTTKSGGHSAAGYALNADGVVLNMTNLNALKPTDKDGLSVGFGTRWINLYNYIENRMRGKLAIGGGCGRVGVGGFLLGGGYSFASRSYGLASDNIRAMEFVATDGSVHQLNDKLTDQNEKDLYWALRGCGGGNYGVVTQAELQLHNTPTEAMMGGQVTFPFYRINEVLPFYNKWVDTLPNEMAVYGMMRYFPDPRRNNAPILCLRFTPVYNGSFAEGAALLKPLIDLNPISTDLYSMTLPEWENFVGGGTLVQGRPAYIRSVIMPPGAMNETVAEICQKYMGTSPSTDTFVVWTHLGGKMAQNTDIPTSYAHRDGGYAVEIKSIWNPEPMSNMRTNVEWTVKFFDELEQHSQGAYLNYIDPLLVDWQQKYYRANYAKLVEVKKHWDPKGFLDFQQSIGSTFNPTRTTPLDLSPLTRTHL